MLQTYSENNNYGSGYIDNVVMHTLN